MTAIGGHQLPYRGRSDDWLTPREIVEALGPFDLDPCCPPSMPWKTARAMASKGGLEDPWFGRVWLNPPYGPETGKWLSKLAQHGNGIALVFARTETDMFFRWVWDCATGLLFLRGRLHFYSVDGVRAKFNSGAPSVLVAYGEFNAYKLKHAGISGKYVSLIGSS